MRWNYVFIPKLQWCNRWKLGRDKYFHPTLYMDIITNPCWTQCVIYDRVTIFTEHEGPILLLHHVIFIEYGQQIKNRYSYWYSSLQNCLSDKHSVKPIFNQFVENATLHGVNYLSSKRNIIRRYMKFTLPACISFPWLIAGTSVIIILTYKLNSP